MRAGVTAWPAAAALKVLQELGDCAVLVHGGRPKAKALLLNAASGATFVVIGMGLLLALKLVCPGRRLAQDARRREIRSTAWRRYALLVPLRTERVHRLCRMEVGRR